MKRTRDRSKEEMPVKTRKPPGIVWRVARAVLVMLAAILGLVLLANMGGSQTAPADTGTNPRTTNTGTTRPGYYRDPAIHGDTIIFTAEGDLWTVSVKGGAAHRLTSNPGHEGGAAISPDGRTVAFRAEYEGPVDVYTMPVEGGFFFDGPTVTSTLEYTIRVERAA